ncbi:hypothetical protein HanRHA438_Chr13g0578431 [Helianthus annuus]|nr:hypothetical protein HanRHA438_Chr13g0578431 [Helianthus annuus]
MRCSLGSEQHIGPADIQKLTGVSRWSLTRAANEPNEHEQDLVSVRLLRNICVHEPFTNTYRTRFYLRIRLLKK